MDKIAWAGELLMLEAKWTDRDGHTVKFKLVSPNEERPNPFKQFTKRRSGRAGSRFYASVTLIDGQDDQNYNGEVMLAGWADTSTNGYTVQFWVEPPGSGQHPFEGYTRNEAHFMAALVELDDDDSPIEQDVRERIEKATAVGDGILESTKAGGDGKAQPFCNCADVADCNDTRASALADGKICKAQSSKSEEKPGPRKNRLSMYAAMLCSNPEFWAWASIQDPFILVANKEQAAEWMRARLGIESRAELDKDELKAQRYHNEIRKPFVAWQEGQKDRTGIEGD